MPFHPRKIAPELVSKLEEFAKSHDLTDLYTRYKWENDTYENAFPDILTLESKLSTSDKSDGISLEDVLAVATWGRLRNRKQIRGRDRVLEANALHTAGGEPNPDLEAHPLNPVRKIEENVPNGLGPTYISKVLRFGLAKEYGAIDTRCVRVFGNGDPNTARHQWLNLKARNDGYGWYIPRNQPGWPAEYGIWISILRCFRHVLPASCPHPEEFVKSGHRQPGEWTCADIEMALFCYASQFT